jgi:hypothetical protein
MLSESIRYGYLFHSHGGSRRFESCCALHRSCHHHLSIHAPPTGRDAHGQYAVDVGGRGLIARRTDDRSRDIDDAIRDQAISRLTVLGIAEETIQLLSKYFRPERADGVRSFGESLPPGLQVVSSSNCLLSVPAMHSSGPSVLKPAEPQAVVPNN